MWCRAVCNEEKWSRCFELNVIDGEMAVRKEPNSFPSLFLSDLQTENHSQPVCRQELNYQSYRCFWKFCFRVTVTATYWLFFFWHADFIWVTEWWAMSWEPCGNIAPVIFPFSAHSVWLLNAADYYGIIGGKSLFSFFYHSCLYKS